MEHSLYLSIEHVDNPVEDISMALHVETLNDYYQHHKYENERMPIQYRITKRNTNRRGMVREQENDRT